MSKGLYLADQSAVSRMGTRPAVSAAFRELVMASATMCSSAVTLDEASYSARNPDDLGRIVALYTESFSYLPLNPAIDAIVRSIRQQLWISGHGRSAQATDVLIAATAVHYDAIVLHYDKHFDLIHGVYPAVQHRWVVPRGSVT